MPGLHGGALLSAPGIFSLPNSFRPCFLSTAGPLSLHLPIRYQLHVPLPSDIPLLQSSSEYLPGFSCASTPSVLHAAFVATFVQPTLLDTPCGPYPAEIARCLTTARNHIRRWSLSRNHVSTHIEAVKNRNGVRYM